MSDDRSSPEGYWPDDYWPHGYDPGAEPEEPTDRREINAVISA